MDGWTAFASLASSVGLVAGGAHWLMQRLINHRLERAQQNYQAQIDQHLARAKTELDKELRDHQAQIDERLARQSSEVDAKLRREVEEYLGDKAAEREYQLDARKRLYTATGLLRFQLVVAASDFASRIASVGARNYQLRLSGYYGRSTLYRLLRLLAVTELINRQMAYADFSVDKSVVTLLRFRRLLFRSLSDQLVENDPTNWKRQEQHLFNDTVLLLSTVGIVAEPDGGQRVIRYDEFSEYLETGSEILDKLRPLPELLDEFTPATRPLWWLRLVTLAAVCNALVAVEGARIGLEADVLDIRSLILKAATPDLEGRHTDYEATIQRFNAGLGDPLKM